MGNFGQFEMAANASAAMQLAGIELVEEQPQLKLSLGRLKTPWDEEEQNAPWR